MTGLDHWFIVSRNNEYECHAHFHRNYDTYDDRRDPPKRHSRHAKHTEKTVSQRLRLRDPAS